MISLRALEILRRNGFEHVETGFYASHVRVGVGVWMGGVGAGGGGARLDVYATTTTTRTIKHQTSNPPKTTPPKNNNTNKTTGAQGRGDSGREPQHPVWLRGL